MNLYIEDLTIPYIVKNHLLNMGFITIFELSRHDYFSLLELYPNCQIISQIVEVLIPLGYLLPPDNRSYIYNVPLSTRLHNILKRNCILYLSQLSAYPEELIFQFRNLGSVTMNELKCICKEYQIHIRTLDEIKKGLKGYNFSSNLYYNFYNCNITSLNDFRYKTTNDLFNICNMDYFLTMKTYDLLKKNNIKLKNQNSIYLFEILPLTKARALWWKLHIKTIDELCKYSEKEILQVHQITPKVLTRLKAMLKEKQLSFKA